MKEAYKGKCFDKSMIFKQYDDFKKESLLTELNPKPGRLESDVND